MWSPWCIFIKRHRLGYSQSYHKMTAVLAGLAVSFPDKTQLLSITTCQFTALLFSVMLWSINCSTDWSKQISAPLKRGQCLRFILTPGGLLPAHYFPGSLQQAGQTVVNLSPMHLPLSSSLPFTISTVFESTLRPGLFHILLQIKLVILERDAEFCFKMLWATFLGVGAEMHYRMMTQLWDQSVWWSRGKGNCRLRCSQLVSFSQCGTATLRAETWVILNGTAYK